MTTASPDPSPALHPRRAGTLRAVSSAFLLLVLALPMAGIATWALLPVWRWVENRTRLEAVGHSGPAGWCYGALYAAALAVAAAAHLWRRRRRRGAARPVVSTPR